MFILILLFLAVPTWPQFVSHASISLTQLTFNVEHVDISGYGEIIVFNSQHNDSLSIYYDTGIQFTLLQKITIPDEALFVDITVDGGWFFIMSSSYFYVYKLDYVMVEFVQFQRVLIKGGIFSLGAISDDHQWIFLPLEDMVEIYNFNGSQYILNQTINFSLPGTIKVTSDSQYFAFTSSSNYYVYKYQADSYTLFDSKLTSLSNPSKVALTNEFLVIGKTNTYAEIFRNTGSSFQKLPNNGTNIVSTVFSDVGISPTHKYIAFYTSDQRINIYQNLTQDNLGNLEEFGLQFRSPKFTKDDGYLVGAQAKAIAILRNSEFDQCTQEYCIRCKNSACLKCNQVFDYFLNSANECEQCSLDNCTKCQSLTSCLICNETEGYFLNPHTKQCQTCFLENCLSCIDPGECEICDGDLNYYKDDETGLCKLCSLEGCLTCQSLTECYECLEIDNYFKDEGICLKCSIQGCRDCLNLTVCERCDQSNNYFSFGDVCLQCKIQNCEQCLNQTHCESCEEGNDWYEDEKVCQSHLFRNWVFILFPLPIIGMLYSFVKMIKENSSSNRVANDQTIRKAK